MQSKSHLTGRLIAACCILLASVPAWSQLMIVNAGDRSLGIYATNGAIPGAALRLHNRCNPQTADCLWSMDNGFLHNRKTNLVVMAVSLQPGAPLVMAQQNQCGPNYALCRWVYRNGMFISAAEPRLAIVAWGGPRSGNELRLNANCNPSIPDCAWGPP